MIQIEKEKKNYYFKDIKVGDCFTRTGREEYLKVNSHSYLQNGEDYECLCEAVKLDNGDVEYFPDNEPVRPVIARVIAEEV